MHLGQASIRHVCFVNGDPVDSCDKFRYLGVPTSNAETVFHSRLSKAWTLTTKLRLNFNLKVNDAIKIGLCRSAVESILLHRLECLQLTLTLQEKHDAVYRHILRYAVGVHFPDCICNAELTRTGATALSKTHRQRRLRLVVHDLRIVIPIATSDTSPLSTSRTSETPWTSANIDNISAINQSVISIISATKSYFN